MTDSPTAKLADLAVLLLDRTKAHDLTWDQSDRPNEFITTLPGASVAVSGQGGFTSLTVRDSNGVDLESIWVNSESAIANDEAERRMADVLPELHQLVRRRVLKVDETLDSLLRALGGPGSIGGRGQPRG